MQKVSVSICSINLRAVYSTLMNFFGFSRVLVDKDNIIEHEPGKGQQAFSYHKRDSSLHISETASSDQGEVNTAAQVNTSLNPLLASLATSKNNCSSYFIEPMEWINGLDQWNIEGRLDCPRCHTKLGSYCWSGAQCSCGRWVTPAFTLHRKQVDEIKAVKLR
jgi:dual specificity phosphatase 12